MLFFAQGTNEFCHYTFDKISCFFLVSELVEKNPHFVSLTRRKKRQIPLLNIPLSVRILVATVVSLKKSKVSFQEKLDSCVELFVKRRESIRKVSFC